MNNKIPYDSISICFYNNSFDFSVIQDIIENIHSYLAEAMGFTQDDYSVQFEENTDFCDRFENIF